MGLIAPKYFPLILELLKCTMEKIISLLILPTHINVVRRRLMTHFCPEESVGSIFETTKIYASELKFVHFIQFAILNALK